VQLPTRSCRGQYLYAANCLCSFNAIATATSVIPIVFAGSGDPVATGLVTSLARPGGNVTGLSNQQLDVTGKRVQLLRDVVPGLRRLAILGNAGNPAIVCSFPEEPGRGLLPFAPQSPQAH
jgi:ABC-type uncharacterized transport system substrate-binding protein